MKKRLDTILHEKYSEYSRRQIQSWIMQGNVTVNKQVVTKAGIQVKTDDDIKLNKIDPKYVSRAGFKLEKALQSFSLSVEGLVALDAGLSTGGFADCLLQNGIKKIFGIEVGFGQTHEKISSDDRVVVMEKTNLRYLESLPELVDIVTLDLSFISVLLVMETIVKLIKKDGFLIVLIKPQFEAQKHQVGRGGIIKDSALHEEIVEKVVKGIVEYGFVCKGVIDSPILGTQGNKEFLACFEYNTIK